MLKSVRCRVCGSEIAGAEADGAAACSSCIAAFTAMNDDDARRVLRDIWGEDWDPWNEGNGSEPIATAHSVDVPIKYIDAERWLQDELAADPGNVRILLKLGDVRVKVGDFDAALIAFGAAADAYADGGWFLKAVAVYKQMLRIRPRSTSARLRLARLYMEVGLHGDGAREALRVIRRAAGEESHLQEAVRVLLAALPADGEERFATAIGRPRG
jgi:tetratricopeptide (TPR) repeat protein